MLLERDWRSVISLLVLENVKSVDHSFLCTQMPIPLHDGAQKYYSEQGLI